ncbi:hypothetical protein [Spirillospora sp. CA-128828]|uniref:hypothetical protein n=1 Tax=Spirillospora sp. CA-128828 TaxID=3240033 RepID=UPI003D8ED6EC
MRLISDCLMGLICNIIGATVLSGGVCGLVPGGERVFGSVEGMPPPLALFLIGLGLTAISIGAGMIMTSLREN